ncbi:MAG: DUF5689 domain-containing protein [Bacteroidales bacterium]|nr:DUF5689 domain-containing protein [Bacteroidales bacterium]
MQQSVHYLKTLFLALTLLFSLNSYGQELFSTNFNEEANWDNPGGGSWTGYNEKTYEEGDWFFHSTESVRGTAGESYGGSAYSFRDRDVFSVHNTGAIAGMSGFSMQLRDWMLGAGEQRNMKVSFDGGDSWETVAVINKAWFEAYQVYQEFVYYFPGGVQSFAAEEFMIELDGGGGTNDGRINIGQFVALGEPTQVATPVFIPNGGTFVIPVDVVIETATPDADIFYSTVSDDGPWTAYSDAVTVDETTTIWAYAAADGLADSNVASATFTFPEVTEVATLAALRDMPADGSYYHYTGEAVIVAMDSYHNRKFIQDETAAILLYDQPGVITTPYDLYDVITDVFGHLNLSSNMLRFHPATNTPPAVTNTPADPSVFGLDEVTADDQAKLVQFVNVSFVNTTEGQVFANGNNYTISDGEEEFTLRTDFWNVDYIGDPIPDEPVNISGVILQHMETLQLIPRFAADFEPYVEEPDPDPEQFTVTFVVKDAAGNDINDAVIVLNDVAYDAGHYVFELEEGTLVEYSVSYPCSADVSGEFEVTEDVEVNVIMAGIAGDANGDGVVDILDVISIVNYYTMTDTDIPCFDNADVNNDDKINVLDLILTVNIFAKGSQ